MKMKYPDVGVKPVDEPQVDPDTGSMVLAESNLGPVEFLPYPQDGEPYLRRVGWVTIGSLVTPELAMPATGEALGYKFWDAGYIRPREFTLNRVTYKGFISVDINLNKIKHGVSGLQNSLFDFNLGRVSRADNKSGSFYHTDLSSSAQEKVKKLLLDVLKYSNYPWWEMSSPASTVTRRIEKDKMRTRHDVGRIVDHLGSQLLEDIPLEPKNVQHYLNDTYESYRKVVLEAFDTRFEEVVQGWKGYNVSAGQVHHAVRIRRSVQDELDWFLKG